VIVRPLPIGLALSGGTAKSTLHVGVVKALVEAGLPIDYIAGTSGGGIAATAYAAGCSIEEMENIANNLSWWKLARVKLTRLGFVSSQPIETFMEGILKVSNFEDLNIPCAVPVTELTTGERVTFSRGPIATIVRASCSIPQIYLPVEIDGGYYVDGGLAEYIPVDSVQYFGNQFTIAVSLASKNETYEKPKHILQLIMQITNMIARQNIAESMAKADFVIQPDTENYSAFDFAKSEQLIELGYQYARQNIDSIRTAWQRKSRLWSRLKRRFSDRDR